MDPNISVEVCGVAGGGDWRLGGVARSPSHESVTTELSLLSISSAASDARVLRLLACKAGQGPDPNLRVASPNPDGKLRRAGSTLPLHPSSQSGDGWREVLAGCAALCAQLGVRRSFSAGELERRAGGAAHTAPQRLATSEVGLCAALEALTLNAASRSCSTWVAVGGSQLPSPQRAQPTQPPRLPPIDNKKVRQNYIKRRLLSTYRALERVSQSEFNLDKLEVRQNYIKRRLLSTYRALERVSQSEFNLDKLEAAAAAAGPGPTTLAVPPPKPHYRYVHPEAAALALTAAEVERERGRPLTKYERNMMIFNWLHTLPDAEPPLPPP